MKRGPARVRILNLCKFSRVVRNSRLSVLLGGRRGRGRGEREGRLGEGGGGRAVVIGQPKPHKCRPLRFPSDIIEILLFVRLEPNYDRSLIRLAPT